ncbi:MAG: ankyrin repeat domain-containing protein [Vulcanimicrobiota bacterium]
MAKFRYTVTDSQGQKKHGTIEAESKVEAIARLSEAGHLVTEVEPEGAASLSGRSMGVLVAAAVLAIVLMVGAPYLAATRKVEQQAESNSLITAIEKGDQKSVASLAKSQPELLNAPGLDGKLPLQAAILTGNQPMVAELVKLGANPNGVGPGGTTPLQWAVFEARPELVTPLLEAGARPDQADEAGNTALHYAVKSNSSEATEAVLKAGVTVTAANKQGQTALHLAAAQGEVPVLELLLEAGADPNRVDAKGQNALHYAAANDSKEAAQILLQKGANASLKDNQGQTPGDLARQEEFTDLADVF